MPHNQERPGGWLNLVARAPTQSKGARAGPRSNNPHPVYLKPLWELTA